MLNLSKINSIREDFPILKSKIYLDSAASSLKPKPLLEKLNHFALYEYANIHRGIYDLSEKATQRYEDSRKKVSDFIGSKKEEVVFTKNTTESLNLVANTLIEYIYQNNIQKNKDINKGKIKVLLSIAEHHSNIVPWFLLQKKYPLEIEFFYLNISKNNIDFDKNDFLEKIKNTDILSITGKSNVLSFKTDEELYKIAKENGCFVIVDGAQLIPHTEFKLNKNIDFLTFSGHKMLSSTGIGVMYGKKDLLEKIPCFLGGGDMIKSVSESGFESAEIPNKFEAGTSPIIEAYSLSLAINYLNKIGMNNVENHINSLSRYANEKLSESNNIKLITKENSNSTSTFVHKKYHPHDVSAYLDKFDICVRAGNHCAEPLHNKLNLNGSLRASYYIYNNFEDIDKLVDAIKKL